jgi:hypothetical protein
MHGVTHVLIFDTPIIIGSAAGILVRVIVMNLNAKALLYLVGRNDETFESVPGTAGISLYNQVAVVVLASCGAYSIDESLII